jgi:hypothetical protein
MAEASITPGLSFPAKLSGRSMAPMAETTCPVRMRQSRWRGAILRRVVRHALIGQHVAVVVDARDHGAGRRWTFSIALKFRHGRRDPVLCRGAVDGHAIDRRAPAPMGRLFAEQDLRPGPPGLQRGLQPGDPAARDDDVHMGVEMLVAVGVAVLSGPAPCRGPPTAG